MTEAAVVASGSDRGRKRWKEVKKTTGRTRIERRTDGKRGGGEWIEGGRMGLEGADGLATNGCGWVRAHYGPNVPRNQSDGYELCEEVEGKWKTGLRRPPWDWCFHFYWSLARKLGERLWNGRPRIVPSLWGDHSTAARTVALSPSNSYRLGRYLYARYVHMRLAGDVSGRFGGLDLSSRPVLHVVTPRRGSGNELNALRQQTAGQTKRFRGGEECLGPRQGSQALKRARDFRVGSLRNERGRKM
ncbi:hypothetical protein NEUTE2DRAFT_130611 [Neurospora tetrasperma FGSC 2509]|nr:hypothetical protein NEUTE2DRAFT_130611 [Neurospora tetrasperma FGSC 2509]